jgi:hypothetical protein
MREMNEMTALVYVLIHVSKLALDEKQNLIPHSQLELDRA